jgi:hypothetical protein
LVTGGVEPELRVKDSSVTAVVMSGLADEINVPVIVCNADRVNAQVTPTDCDMD